MKCEVIGLNFFRGDEGGRSFRTMAVAKLEFPELKMSLGEVRLTHSADKGWRAVPPIAQRNGNRAVSWSSLSPVALAACKAMLAMYEKMGGQMPEAVANNIAAKQRIAERKSAVPYRTVDKIDEDIAEMSDTPDISEMGLSRPETAGLARTLGIA